MKFDYDVLIIGGGPSGLSAALALGRLNRTALVCDDGRPRNAPSLHLNNFPTRDGIHPAEWRRLAREDLKKYPSIELRNIRVERVEKVGLCFAVDLDGGDRFWVKKIILAYGIHDQLLPIPGMRELWGKSIFHCPFCHGFEIRGEKMAMLVSSEMALHAMPMIQSLSTELTVFTNGFAVFTDEQRQKILARGIQIEDAPIERLIYEGEQLQAIQLQDGNLVHVPYLFYQVPMPFELKSPIGTDLGCAKTPFGLYQTFERGETSVPGVFACGDNMSPMHSVLLAAASGATAGAAVIHQLLNEH